MSEGRERKMREIALVVDNIRVNRFIFILFIYLHIDRCDNFREGSNSDFYSSSSSLYVLAEIASLCHAITFIYGTVCSFIHIACQDN